MTRNSTFVSHVAIYNIINLLTGGANSCLSVVRRYCLPDDLCGQVIVIQRQALVSNKVPCVDKRTCALTFHVACNNIKYPKGGSKELKV